MKCDKCGAEIVDEYETKSFNGLIITKVIQLGNSFNDLVIPKGFCLLTLSEAVELVNNPDFVVWIDFKNEKNDFFIEQPFNQNKQNSSAAWLGCYINNFDIYADDNLNYNDAARGVVLKKVK